MNTDFINVAISKESLEQLHNILTQIYNCLATQNDGVDLKLVSVIIQGIAVIVTPILGAVFSYIVTKKVEKQKATISQSNIATLDMFRELEQKIANLSNNSMVNAKKADIDKSDVIKYISACITVSTKKIAEYYNITQQDMIKLLNELENDNRIYHVHSSDDPEKWLWQLNNVT